MIPIVYKANTKSKEIDEVTLENYLAQEANLNQNELIGEIEPENNIVISNTKIISPEALEEILVSNASVENLVIESLSQN